MSDSVCNIYLCHVDNVEFNNFYTPFDFTSLTEFYLENVNDFVTIEDINTKAKYLSLLEYMKLFSYLSQNLDSLIQKNISCEIHCASHPLIDMLLVFEKLLSFNVSNDELINEWLTICTLSFKTMAKFCKIIVHVPETFSTQFELVKMVLTHYNQINVITLQQH